MKTSSHILTVCSLLAFAWPSAAQTLSPPSKEVEPSTGNAGVVSDGIAVYRGQAYLLRNGRAVMINRALVPEGQFLTWEGRLATLPTGFSIYDNIAAEKDGFMVFHGQTFWLHRGQAALLNNTVVPEGQVLTAGGHLVPLPPDFSGFVRDRTPAGSALPVSSDVGTEALPNQTGVPQVQQGGNQAPSSGTTPPTAGGNANGAATTGGAVSSNGAVSNADGSFVNNSSNIYIDQGYRPVGGVSPASGVHTIPGTTAAHITNGSTRTNGSIPPGGTVARRVGGGPRDKGTKATTVHGVTIVDTPDAPVAGTNVNNSTKSGPVTAAGGANANTANGSLVTNAGGATATTTDGVAATAANGAAATAAGGAPTTANGAPVTTTGGAPATTAGGAPASTANGAPATTAGGAPATTTNGAPATPAGGAPATTPGGSGGR